MRKPPERQFANGVRVVIVNGVYTGKFAKVVSADWKTPARSWLYTLELEGRPLSRISKKEFRLRYADPDFDMAEGL